MNSFCRFLLQMHIYSVIDRIQNILQTAIIHKIERKVDRDTEATEFHITQGLIVPSSRTTTSRKGVSLAILNDLI